MNGFKCNVTNSTSDVPLAKPRVARRCGADPENGKLQSSPANCTFGAKAPFYWFNLERNNVFEGAFSPPVYNDLYNFRDGSQDDIFEDSYLSLPNPAPNAPLPILAIPGLTPNPTFNSTESDTNCTSKSTSASSVSPSGYIYKRVSGTLLQRDLKTLPIRRHSRRLDVKHRNRL